MSVAPERQNVNFPAFDFLGGMGIMEGYEHGD
jgi:hypothetical protein